MYLIRQLASKYGLTRTALLHYDSIGLLSPCKRSETGYRLYSEQDEMRLQKILLFRSMGIPLENIKILLDPNQSHVATVLISRINELNHEIGALKKQQKNILDLLKEVKVIEEYLANTTFSSGYFPLLSGITPSEWHRQFEEMSPELHREFLEIIKSIPEETKRSLQKAIDSLPEGEKESLKRTFKQNH